MNILYVLDSGDPGGMEKHVLDLAGGMLSEGHRVYVWCAPGPYAAKFKKQGASVVTRKIKSDIDAFYIFKLAGYIKEEKIDLIHAHELKAVVNSLLASFFAGLRTRVTHTHTPISEWQISPLKKKINVWVYRFFVNKLSSCEIALTESRKSVKIAEGIDPDIVQVIPNGIDLEEFTISLEQRERYREEIFSTYEIPEGMYVFGNISRMTKEKGHDVLIRAYKEFTRILEGKGLENNSHLFIGGGGTLEDSIRDLADELEITDHVTITGRFDFEEGKKFYSTFDSFVFPSLAEGFGFVLIEAMAFGLPVICSNLEVLEEVGGATVRYFDAGDSTDLAQKMFDLYNRTDQYISLGETARSRVEDLYTLDSFISRYLDLYEELVQK